MTQVGEGLAPILEQAARATSGPAWLAELRARGAEAFGLRGFPTMRDEEWRYTNVSPISRTPFEPVEDRPSIEGPFARPFSEAWDGLERRLGSVADARPFSALNTAFLEDGAAVIVPPGTVVEEPIRLTFNAGAPGMSHPRVLIVLGEDAQATVIESYTGTAGGRFRNALTEIVLGRGAVLDHTRLQDEGPGTYHVGTVTVRQEAASQLTSHVVSLGALLARLEVAVALQGEGSGCVLNGLYLGRGRQHVDCRTIVDHLSPRASSNQLYKGVLDGSARGVFDGRVVVHKNAQKTDAHQTNKNLLLSREALADSKPQLEIYNNDVRCTHGSTTGQLDPDALFYLRARGLDERAAKGLLTYAFASELIGKLKAPALRAALEARLMSWLPGSAADAKEEARP